MGKIVKIIQKIHHFNNQYNNLVKYIIRMIMDNYIKENVSTKVICKYKLLRFEYNNVYFIELINYITLYDTHRLICLCNI